MESRNSETGSDTGFDSITGLSFSNAEQISDDIMERVASAVVTDTRFLQLLLTGIMSRGHIHLEDVPGTGKTVAAQVLAQSLGMSFNRIQFTPDLLPADITGSHIYNEVEKEFSFQKGPVFSNIVLADEINRAPPKTQAALLEAMGEGQVSIDGTSYELPKPFFVIATQNPIEQSGTFELPEAQRDRFSIKTEMGYPDEAGELELLNRRENRRTQSPSVSAVSDTKTIRQLQATAENVTVSEDVKSYMIQLARYTREHNQVKTGVSPRGVQKMFEATRAFAILQGRDYVTPNDVKELSESVYSHRLVLNTDAAIQNVEPESIVDEATETIIVPGSTG